MVFLIDPEIRAISLEKGLNEFSYIDARKAVNGRLVIQFHPDAAVKHVAFEHTHLDDWEVIIWDLFIDQQTTAHSGPLVPLTIVRKFLAFINAITLPLAPTEVS